jgi:sterol desaturase/sphingolipid hydroxylase (fatty acid hydroxylase superfamily)
MSLPLSEAIAPAVEGLPSQVVAASPLSSPRPPFLRQTLLIGFAALLIAGLAFWLVLDPGIGGPVWKELAGSAATLYRTVVVEFLFNPWLYVLIGGVLLLERLLPAVPGQGTLASGIRNDIAWVVIKLVLGVVVVGTWVALLRVIYSRYLSVLTVHQVDAWPKVARIVLAVLFADAVFYVTHYVRHKVSVLWYFHAVHHSQRELNFFTEYRVHPVDDLFLYTIGFIPLFMVEHSFVTVVAIVWIRHWHTRFYHSNIRTNLGPLRYILVTPQSHRVHHSVEPPHFDKNFGLTFSLWDQLFGTQYRGWDEYPATGIDDPTFPAEQDDRTAGAFSTLMEQLLYPFRAIARHGSSRP